MFNKNSFKLDLIHLEFWENLHMPAKDEFRLWVKQAYISGFADNPLLIQLYIFIDFFKEKFMLFT